MMVDFLSMHGHILSVFLLSELSSGGISGVHILEFGWCISNEQKMTVPLMSEVNEVLIQCPRERRSNAAPDLE